LLHTYIGPAQAPIATSPFLTATSHAARLSTLEALSVFRAADCPTVSARQGTSPQARPFFRTQRRTALLALAVQLLLCECGVRYHAKACSRATRRRANVNHMRDERRPPVISRQSILPGILVHVQYSRLDTCPRKMPWWNCSNRRVFVCCKPPALCTAITTCSIRFILPTVRVSLTSVPSSQQRKMQPDPRRHTPIPNPWEKLPRHP
jgi:hypothetical protein